jgi:hypothetical protein
MNDNTPDPNDGTQPRDMSGWIALETAERQAREMFDAAIALAEKERREVVA